MTLYEAYKRHKIDLSPVGCENRDIHSDYFCTPKGAKLIGWAGVDGIHYCFLKDFGEMVFAVNPMNTPGDNVHPLARNFEDFLRLLLSCGDLAAAEQAHAWDQAQFDAFLKENPPTPEQTAALKILQDKFSLTPLARPFAYLKELQASFDYSKLKFKADYYDWVPKQPKEPRRPAWKVFFDAGFGAHHGRDHAGKEVPLGKQFVWGGKVWHIPAMYVCAAGLVIDFCMEVDPEHIRAFLEKWCPSHEAAPHFSDETWEQIQAEDPMNLNFHARIERNGTTLRQRHGWGCAWLPASCRTNGSPSNTWETKWILEHYGLDPEHGWSIHRIAFPWTTQRKPALRSLKLIMEQEPVSIPGPHFADPKAGDHISFTHPATGKEHTLTVREYEQQETDPRHFQNENLEYPTHYTAMTYTIQPELPDGAISVNDCAQGDPPREKQTSPYLPFLPTATHFAALAVIGGGACSSLHFEPADHVEWRITFHEKPLDDIEIQLPESLG